VQLAPFKKIEGKPTRATGPSCAKRSYDGEKSLPRSAWPSSPTSAKKTTSIRREEPVAARLALLAGKIAYGQNIVAVGPVYKKIRTRAIAWC